MILGLGTPMTAMREAVPAVSIFSWAGLYFSTYWLRRVAVCSSIAMHLPDAWILTALTDCSKVPTGAGSPTLDYPVNRCYIKDVPDEKPQSAEELDADVYERLNTIEDFQKLTPIQRQILFSHVRDPYLSKDQIAKNLGVAKSVVYRLFFNPKMDKINEELAMQEKREILQLAIKTMRDCLSSKNESVRLAAAERILNDAGIMKKEPKAVKQDNTFNLTWKGQAPFGAINALPGNQLLSAPEASGDTQ